MSVLTFVDDLIGHIAWPIVAVIAILVFRQVLRSKIGDMSEADMAVGSWHSVFKFHVRRKAQSELNLVGSDLSAKVEASQLASQPQLDVDANIKSIDYVAKIATPETTKQLGGDQNRHVETAEETKQWAGIRAHLSLNPHYAIHLAGMRIDAALIRLAGPDAPALGMLVRPGYLAQQGLISQELADASFRLLRIRNTVEESPKFMLTYELADDYVRKARELVAELGDPPQ